MGEQSKGPRLQKLRAIQLLLGTLERLENVHAYCAVESDGDVYLRESDCNGSQEYHEEDKNYDTDGNFTLASQQVINTLVIFADCWIGKACRDDVIFGFYAPNNYAKERASDRSKRLLIQWPEKPMLEVLALGDYSDDRTLTCAKLIILDEYRLQYPENSDGKSRGNLAVLESWEDGQWRGFFAQITWQLGQEDHVQLEASLKDRIRRSRLYSQALSGREGHIISLMCDLLDNRQSLANPLMRYVHVADLQLIFLEVASGTHKLPDPSYKTWQNLPKPEDARNLADKVRAICREATRAEVGRWSRKAANSLTTQREYEDDVTLLSMKYRVFDACDDKLHELRRSHGSSELTADELSGWVDALVECCESSLEECSKHFVYTISGKAFIVELIWELIDSCYLAFDVSAA